MWQSPPLEFDRDSEAGRGVGKVYSDKKGRLQLCPDWRLLPQGSRGRITRSEASYVSGLGSIFGFL